MWVYLIIGVCAFSVLQFAIGFAALARLLPTLFALGRYLVRLLLVGSFRLYRLLLTLAAPLLTRYFNINVLGGIARLISTVLLSVSAGLAALWLLHWSLSLWTISPPVLHGLIVGLLWDDMSEPGSLRLGVKKE